MGFCCVFSYWFMLISYEKYRVSIVWLCEFIGGKMRFDVVKYFFGIMGFYIYKGWRR